MIVDMIKQYAMSYYTTDCVCVRVCVCGSQQAGSTADSGDDGDFICNYANKQEVAACDTLRKAISAGIVQAANFDALRFNVTKVSFLLMCVDGSAVS